MQCIQTLPIVLRAFASFAVFVSSATVCSLAQDARPASSPEIQQSGENIPIPPRRPADLSSAPSANALRPKDAACTDSLRDEGFEFEIVETPAGQCAIDTPVRLLRGLQRADFPEVRFPEKPVVACAFARTFGQWTRLLAAPMARGFSREDISAISTGPGFECRARNRQPGAKMSAHGSGLALDVAGFTLSGGRRLAITDRQPANEPFLRALRTASCGWFTTILGPGSDPFHSDHWHLDTIQHGSSLNYRICQ